MGLNGVTFSHDSLSLPSFNLGCLKGLRSSPADPKAVLSFFFFFQLDSFLLVSLEPFCLQPNYY